MTHFFEKRDPWGHGVALWVLLGLVFAASPLLSSLGQLELVNDVRTWLPAVDAQARVLDWYDGQAGA